MKDARSQTMTIMFKSGSYIQILNGLVNHEVPLFGAQIYGIEFYSICFDNGFNRYQFDLYASSSSYFSRLPGQNPDLRTSLTSLWLTNRPEICLTIVYAMTSRSKDYEYVCYQDEMPNDSAPVKIQIETDTGRLHSVLNYCLESNGDIVRMVVNYNQNNTGIDDEIIRFLIQIEDKVHMRYIYNSICGNSLYPVKQDACNRLDKVAFDVAYKHNYYERASSVEYCGNGGKLVDGSCVCPPGFMGKHCEVACGENKFGRDCTGQCTRPNISSVDAPLECRGMLLCTQYGCGCAPGYQGNHCDQQCARGFYGNDCKTRCGQCINSTSCNIYTGHCNQCDSVYLIPPYCQESYPYVTKPLKILNVSYFSIHLEVNAQPQYIKGYSKDLSADYFHVIRTKDLTWNTEKDTTEFALDLDNPNATYLTRNNWVLNSSYFKQDIWIHDLVPGHMYTFQLILYDDLNQTHDPNIAPVTRVMTKCIIPAYEHKTQVIVASTTATVYWYVTNTTYNDWNITKHDVNDTTRISEINKLFNTTKLEVLEDLFNLTDDDINVVFKCREPPRYNLTVKKISKKRSQEYKFTNIKSGFTLKYLDPGSSYLVRLYLNNNNYTYEILNSVVDTKPELSVMEDLEIVEKVGSVLTIKWSSVDQNRRISGPQKTKSTLTDHTNKTKSVEPTIYYIKYKIVKQRACNQYFNHNTMVESTNHTSFTLHLHYFTTYSIFVTTNKGQTLSTKYLYVSFDASVPNISPNLPNRNCL
ncbi:uncharacterized protein LOC103519205 [Diaphorina citri]|uniref:Uncharacterized protein LOC103519205 n=1 Tax=Diaphorina citri TaxID=121845 RepID=A0A3Q0JDJ5_DIACI|nr:uncharacterized protein LOC103519205 [Diaphorina citri]